MAIAYFIPDQAKLLAGQRPTSSNTASRSPSNSQPSSRPQSQQSNESAPVNTTVNRGYGTTINITVPTLNNTTQEPLGCWDFLTQVFCHALRFYHESSQVQPTVIQISVNFNSQPAAEAETVISANTAATSTTNPQQPPAAEPLTNSSTSEEQKSRKFPRRNN